LLNSQESDFDRMVERAHNRPYATATLFIWFGS
jgi:hypothetical protein